MNKYHFKKMLTTLTLAGSMILVGCSNTKNKYDSSPNQEIEKEVDDTPRPTELKEEQDENQEIMEKKDLIRRIEEASFDPLIEDIFKSIATKVKNYDTDLIGSIRASCDDESTKNLSIYNVIFEAIKKQKKENNYQIKKLKIFNNLDKKQQNLPKQILLMKHCSTYGKYKFYEMIGLKTTLFLSLVTDLENHVLLVVNRGKVKKVKNISLQNFSKLLKAYDIEPKEKYTYDELCWDLTFRLSKKINDDKNKKSKTIKVKNMIVVDTEKVDTKENTDKRYYFLKYRYPYLFASKTDVYSDIFNLNAKVVINQDHALDYQDFRQNIIILDSTRVEDIESSFQSLNEFLIEKNIPYKRNVSYEELSKINEKVNRKDKKVKVK